ncbi:neural cell adhesion molecule 2 [Anabrus simplex]|uniref:neural cell adhesion molecule 2 n=1 Tax=Anabrus simplex TaxID=316456 RepID=UPI0035A32D79
MWCIASKSNGVKQPGGFILSIIIFYAGGVVADDALDFQKSLPARVVWAVSGQDAELPCNVTPPDSGDRVNMVLWFKDTTTGIPLYSLDAREGDVSKAQHWAISNDLGARTDFQTSGPSMGRLRIKNVRLDDEGVFRCRIDFFNSPTVNYRINLTIIVPPPMPVIYDSEHQEVTGMAGPFREGYDMSLVCNVSGGRPRPEVSWWFDHRVLDGIMEEITESSTVNVLSIPTVPRSMWNSYLECRAQSSNLTDPVIRKVPLDIYLKPRKVQLHMKNTLLSAGKPYVFHCESAGAFPAADIKWLLDGEQIRGHNVTETKGVNTTSSTLIFRPRVSDDGRELACRAESPFFSGGILEDRKRLHVAYPPVVSVQLETSAAQAPLREGDEVRLSCEVRAKPEPDRITWYHRGALLDYNETSGVLPDDRTLRLRSITRDMAGDYSCAASNSEGEIRSPTIRIRVQYAPRCRPGYESRKTGALRHRAVTARCEVEADPAGEDVKFQWTFERGREVIRAPSTWIKSKGLSSELTYEPRAESDFGTLACYAVNSVGNQKHPCLVHIVQARTPQPPGQCQLRNQTSERLEVLCEAGSDGDLPQHFVLEVSEAPVTSSPPSRAGVSLSTLNDQGAPSLPLGTPLLRKLGAAPRFTLDSLEPGRDYQLAIFAVNAKGRSEPPVIIPSVRFSTAMEKLTRTDVEDTVEETSTQPMAIVLGVLIAAAVLIVGGIFTTAALVTYRRRTALAELERQTSGPKATRASRRSMYGEEEVELDIAANFGDGPRVRFRCDDDESTHGGIEDEGGGGARGRPLLHEPDLIMSRAEVPPESAASRTSC